MDRYDLEALVNKQVFMEMFVNRASIEMRKESAEILDVAVGEIVDRWTEIFDKIYETYPALVEGRIEIGDVIYPLMELFYNKDDIKDFNAEQFEILADTIANIAMTFFEGYSKVMECKKSRAWVKDKLGLE